MTKAEYDELVATVQSGNLGHYNGRSALFPADIDFICEVEGYDPNPKRPANKKSKADTEQSDGDGGTPTGDTGDADSESP